MNTLTPNGYMTLNSAEKMVLGAWVTERGLSLNGIIRFDVEEPDTVFVRFSDGTTERFDGLEFPLAPPFPEHWSS